jgi:GGDEF domain-containing protein
MLQEDLEALEKFLFALDWSLACRARYPDHFQVGLVHIDYRNPERIGDAFGAKEGSLKLDEVAHALRRTFRKTDLVARNGTDFWILLPHVPTVDKVSEKIRYIVDTWSDEGLKIVERDISFFVFDNDLVRLAEDLAPLEILAYLKENHKRYAAYEAAFAAAG